MPVGRKPLEMVHEVLVQEGLVTKHGPERGSFLAGRQFTENQQHRRLHEGALPGKLLYGIPAIPQDALFAIDKGDGAVTRTGIGIALIQSDESGTAAQTGHIHRNLAFGAPHDGQFVGLAVDGQCGRIIKHISSSNPSPRQEKDQS